MFIGKTEAEAETPILWLPDSLEDTLMLGKIKGKRTSWQRIKWLGNNTNSIDMNLSKLQEIVKDRETWCAAVHEVAKSRARLSN